MAVADRRAKDNAMAMYMKAHKIERTSGRCCICYRMVPLDSLYIHLTARCPGPERKGARTDLGRRSA